jgi:hypothetical protein
MPLEIGKPVWNRVSVLELWAKIGGGTPFGVEQIIQMLDYAEKEGQDFRINHAGVNYLVPVDRIRDYFIDHARPVPKMRPAEELIFLRRHAKELEARLAEAGLEPEQPGMKPALNVTVKDTTPPPLELREEPIVETEPMPPERPLTEDEQRVALKKELEGKKPKKFKATTT